MRVLALVPPMRENKNVVRDVLYGCWCVGKRIGGATVPPLSLLSVATVVKHDGHAVTLMDAPAEGRDIESVQKEIKDFEIVFVLTSTMTFNEDLWAINKLKEKHPRLLSIFFGSQPSFMPENCLRRSGVDIIVRKEPELAIRDVIRGLNEKSDGWKSVRGIGFMENGVCRINDDYPFVSNLDDLPIMDRTLLPAGANYFNPFISRYPFATTCTSRGCPGKCTFCTASAFFGKKIRFNSAEKVLEEIEYLIKMGYHEVYFRDETFSIFRKRNQVICEAIIKRGLDIAWIANARAGTIEREELELYRQAGCHLIKVGVESGSQKVLDNMQKGITTGEIRELFRNLKATGIDSHAHLMLGNPGETKETVEETMKFVNEIEPTTIDYGICTPYPGSTLFEDLKKTYPDLSDGTDTDLSNLHVKGLFNEYYSELKGEELEAALRRAYRSFYMRPRYIFGWLRRITSLGKFRKIMKAGFNTIYFSLKNHED